MVEKRKKLRVRSGYNDDAILRKHTATVHTDNIISALDRKIFNALMLAAGGSIQEEKRHQLPLCELALDIGWDSNPSKYLQKVIKRMNTIQMEWNILGADKKNSWMVTTLLSDVGVINGVVYYSFSKLLRKCVSSPNIYTMLNLKYQKTLKRKPAVALWEFCSEQLDRARQKVIKTEEIPLDKVKALLLGTRESSSYDQYKLFNQKVLKPAIAEVQEKTDIAVDVQTRSEGRSISHISFVVKRNKQQLNLPLPLEDENGEVKSKMMGDLQDKASLIGVDEEKLQLFTSKYDIEKIFVGIDSIIEKIEAGKEIENIEGYLWKTLENQIYKETSSKEAAKRIEREKEKKYRNCEKEIEDYTMEEQDPLRKDMMRRLLFVLPPDLRNIERIRKIHYKINEILSCGKKKVEINVYFSYFEMEERRYMIESSIKDSIRAMVNGYDNVVLHINKKKHI